MSNNRSTMPAIFFAAGVALSGVGGILEAGSHAIKQIADDSLSADIPIYEALQKISEDAQSTKILHALEKQDDSMSRLRRLGENTDTIGFLSIMAGAPLLGGTAIDVLMLSPYRSRKKPGKVASPSGPEQN